MKPFESLRPRLHCLLTLTMFQVLLTAPGNARNFELQVIDKVSLLFETGHYSSETGPGNRLYILDDTVRISQVIPGSRIMADLVHFIEEPQPAIPGLSYRLLTRTDSSAWTLLPAASNAGRMVLATVQLAAGNAVTIEFRHAGDREPFQQTIIERPAWKPELLAFFQDRQPRQDSIANNREAWIASLRAAKKPPVSRLPLLLEPGVPAQFLFKQPGLYNDSCIEYRYAGLHSDTSSGWIRSDVLVSLPEPDGNTEYLLEARYPHSPEILSLLLKVKPYWYQQPVFLWTAGGLLILSLAGLVWFFFRKRLKRSQRQRDEAQIQLQLMHIQLKPHFIYNALGSIMGLIDTARYDEAKQYLNIFSGMMQHIVEKSNEPAISLAEEMDQMIEYMRMEQLRFQFRFEVHIDPGINLSQVELPPQLIQPAIENAVQHGAAGLGSQGEVTLRVYASGQDLCISVINNALPGKQIRQSGLGMGIRFTRLQIAKLQQLYKDRQISFQLKLHPSGAESYFYFQNWLNPIHV